MCLRGLPQVDRALAVLPQLWVSTSVKFLESQQSCDKARKGLYTCSYVYNLRSSPALLVKIFAL
jgi:hypothetical protein